MNENILSLLVERDHREKDPYVSLFSYYETSLNSAIELRLKNLELNNENEALLRKVKQYDDIIQRGDRHQNYELQDKILNLQSENSELLREISKVYSLIIHLNAKLQQEIINVNKNSQETNKLYQQNLSHLGELDCEIKRLDMKCNELKEKKKSLEDNNDMLRMEHSASMLTIKSLETKILDLSETIMTSRELYQDLSKKLAEYRNAEQEILLRQEREKQVRELEEAACQILDVDGGDYGLITGLSKVPTRIVFPIPQANEGDVNQVLFGPTGKIFACAGSDRKIRIWHYNEATYIGCNQTITSIDIDPQEEHLLGSSNDMSCRIWSIESNRIKTNFTGHLDKVFSAKFVGQINKVVSVAADRTLKLWSVERQMCLKTIQTTSLGHDVVYNPNLQQLITGHFDKKLRIWDMRGLEVNTDQITLPGKVTGLDISKNCNYVLVSTRDDALRILDLRMNQVVECFQDDDFRIGMDFVRPCFSPDANYVASGGQDGYVYIWKRSSKKLETRLKGHDSAVVSCSWRSPQGDILISCERHKQAILWGP